MALSTQVFILSLSSLVADSYLFVYNGPNSHRLSIKVPDRFTVFPDIFDDPLFRHYKLKEPKPYISSEVNSQKKIPKDATGKIATETVINFPNDAISPGEDTVNDEDNSTEQTVKIGPTEPSIVNNEAPTANPLSIHEDNLIITKPILSVKIPEEKPLQIRSIEDKGNTTETVNDTKADGNIDSKEVEERNKKNEPELTKHTDLLIIPVNAINLTPTNTPSLQNIPTSNPNAHLTSMYNTENSQNYNQGSYPVNQNVPNAVNGISNQNMNQGYQDNEPIRYTNVANSVPQLNYPNLMNNNGGQPNLYTLVKLPNMQGNNNGLNNMYYLMNNPNQMNNGYQTPNSAQLYHVVPLQNLPNNGANQVNNFVPYNNQPNNFVPYNNQPNNVGPYNNQPNNFVPYNNQGNSFVPINNQPNNYVPVNNNFVPYNNQPDNFVPNNQPNNFLPFNNQPNNYVPNNVPLNNGQHNFGPLNNNNYPMNNGQNYYVPANNFPSNNVPVNNNNNLDPVNYNNNFVPLNNNHFIPSNKEPNNFVSNNNGPNNFVPLNEQPNNVVSLVPINNFPVSQPQPIATLINFEEEEEKKDEGIDV